MYSLALILFLAGAATMELGAYLQHRFLWHRGGPLAAWHASHHRSPEPIGSSNDVLAFVNAGCCMAACLISYVLEASHIFSFVTGVTFYGMMYLICHDGFVHGRWNLRHFAPTNSLYFRRLENAHLKHHAQPTCNYGFFVHALFA